MEKQSLNCPDNGTPKAVFYVQDKSIGHKEEQMLGQFEIRYVMGHVEVFDANGCFCFSADNMAEAVEELREEGLAA